MSFKGAENKTALLKLMDCQNKRLKKINIKYKKKLILVNIYKI